VILANYLENFEKTATQEMYVGDGQAARCYGIDMRAHPCRAGAKA
jgi:hypothetical protein